MTGIKVLEKPARLIDPISLNMYMSIVFNFPAGDTVSEVFQSNVTYYQLIRQYGRERVNSDRANFGRIITRPVDKRENYVKRLIAMPGDTLQIIDGVVYINGEMGYQPPYMQHNYLVKINGSSLNPKVLERYGISEGYRTPVANEFILNMNATTAEEFGTQPFVTEVKRIITPANAAPSQEIFPNDTTHFRWNVDNFGPIVIPQEGVTVKINPENIALYTRCITAYEHNTLDIKDNKIFTLLLEHGANPNTKGYRGGYLLDDVICAYLMSIDNRIDYIKELLTRGNASIGDNKSYCKILAPEFKAILPLVLDRIKEFNDAVPVLVFALANDVPDDIIGTLIEKKANVNCVFSDEKINFPRIYRETFLEEEEGEKRNLKMIFDFSNKKYSRTALYIAVERRRLGAVKLLLEHGANKDWVSNSGKQIRQLETSEEIKELLK